MINFFVFVFFCFSGIDTVNPLKNTSWILEKDGKIEVRIYSDSFFVSTLYDGNQFISTYGGFYSLGLKKVDILVEHLIESNDGLDVEIDMVLDGYNYPNYIEAIEFNSTDFSHIGDTLNFSDFAHNFYFYENKSIYINENRFMKLKHYDSKLNGSWLMSGIERGGEIRMRDVNRSRKTMKMLAGGRFQWIAYDIDKKGFYGTGGGIFTSENGKYIENIEFFSRDNSKVGISLEFNFEVKEGDWHHKGFSSKGDPKYEIWTQRKQ